MYPCIAPRVFFSFVSPIWTYVFYIVWNVDTPKCWTGFSVNYDSKRPFLTRGLRLCSLVKTSWSLFVTLVKISKYPIFTVQKGRLIIIKTLQCTINFSIHGQIWISFIHATISHFSNRVYERWLSGISGGYISNRWSQKWRLHDVKSIDFELLFNFLLIRLKHILLSSGTLRLGSRQHQEQASRFLYLWIFQAWVKCSEIILLITSLVSDAGWSGFWTNNKNKENHMIAVTNPVCFQIITVYFKQM